MNDKCVVLNAQKINFDGKIDLSVLSSHVDIYDDTSPDQLLDRIRGAGLDVQESEPPAENSPLYTLDNVILTPHMGWKGLETRQRLVSVLADNIAGFLAGTPRNVVS